MHNVNGNDGQYRAVLKVVGVGGAGINAVNAMIDAGVQGIEFICLSFSARKLSTSKAQTLIRISADPKGLGTGGNPECARQAMAEHQQQLAESVQDADMIFITAGMGSGTGTGASPLVAHIARQAGALVVGVVTTPFMYEGKKRMTIAQAGITELAQHTDCLIVIPNEKLVAISEKGLSLRDAFKPADEILRQAIQGIAELINSHGVINADFNDVKTVMKERGTTMIGIGVAEGEQRASEACTRAVNSPLLPETNLHGARGLLVNITAGPDMTMDEFNIVTAFFHEKVSADANIIIGLVVDEALVGQIKVTVIATGLPGNRSTGKHLVSIQKPGGNHAR